MIFVTTGTQLPFPRLIAAMDILAPQLQERIVAQIGPDCAPYTNLECYEKLKPTQFAEHFEQARVIVAHAGIGTILSAKASQKPLILLPRQHDLGEHRNDHQLATARQVEEVAGVHIAWDESALPALLLNKHLCTANPYLGPSSDTLLDRIRQFIDA